MSSLLSGRSLWTLRKRRRSSESVGSKCAASSQLLIIEMSNVGYIPISALPVAQSAVTPTEAFFNQFTTQTRYELNGPAVSIARHPQAAELAVASSTQVMLYKVSEAALAKGTGRFEMTTTAVAYRHDGAFYVAADDSGAVEVFIPGSHSWQRRFYDSSTAVHAVSFSATDQEVLAGTRSGKLFAWTVTTETLCFGVQAHADSIRAAFPLPSPHAADHFAPVLTASYDRYIRIWNMLSGEIALGVSEDPKRRNAVGRSGTGPSMLFEYSLSEPIDAAIWCDGYVYIACGGYIYSLLYVYTDLSLSEDNKDNRGSVKLKAHAQSDYVPKGISSLCACSTSMGTFILAGCFDGGVRVYDSTTLLQVATLIHFDVAVLSIAVQSFSQTPIFSKKEELGIYVGLQTKTMVVLTSCPLEDAIALANEKDKPKQRLSKRDFMIRPRANLDYMVHGLNVRPSLSQLDVYLAIYKHLDALQLSLLTSRELTGSVLLELECRGIKNYHDVLRQLRDGDKAKILEYTMSSLGNNMLCGPFLRACDVIIPTITLSSSSKLLLTVHEFLMTIEKELELIENLQQCRNNLCSLKI